MRLLVLVALTACAATDPLDGMAPTTGTDDLEPPGSVDPSTTTTPLTPLDALPPSLAATGFYSLPLYEFTPQFKLFSDGAEKQRWLYLPAGAKIDTSNPDYWSFPIGTRLWKQFTLDNNLVETRYMAKYGPADSDWLFIAFAWDDTPAVDGIPNARGTIHDIPPQSLCTGCHANVRSRVLGFSAIQLDYTAPSSAALDLDKATSAGLLSTPPPSPGAASPHYPIPGTASERAALGYFHANCGHCHNSQSPLVNRPSFRLETDHLASLAATRTYQTTVNVQGREPFGGATIIAKPGDPDHSIIFTRMKASDPKRRMPALANEVIDTAGITQLRSWITNL